MITYDDKTKGIIESVRRFVLPTFEPCDAATFKASYIVASDVKCEGKITALFDLIVLGSIEASELDINGRFVCLGNCNVNGSIIVHNNIWVNDIRAKTIEVHDRIVAQEINCTTIFAYGSIVVGKILAVGELALSSKNVICGETAYGAGKVSANTVITGEPIDLDDGVDAVVSPSVYNSSVIQQKSPATTRTKPAESTDLILHGETEYAPLENFRGYLDFLVSVAHDDENKARFTHWKNVLCEAETTVQSGIGSYTNVAILLWLSEIVSSVYFKSWNKIYKLFDTLEIHFKDLVQRDRNAVECAIENYSEWLCALSILNRFGALIDSTVYNVAYELVISNLGLKARFVSGRLSEKGWQAHAE
ncbi:MAG: hypothetical protein ZNDK_1107 [Candidatus Desulfovibrio kirbyi]|uniref:Uncharacterized protein n=1 Tax=Candidatus Desulfovibrio kirbyi TaxID=2696086 RepID=A0A6L2R731_9BACT|nr:MAG: hypothetical protein ZNDK_1107 [Candidatus Desulfovibrio kirbyi]